MEESMDKLSRDGNKNTQYWLKDFGDIVKLYGLKVKLCVNYKQCVHEVNWNVCYEQNFQNHIVHQELINWIKEENEYYKYYKYINVYIIY